MTYLLYLSLGFAAFATLFVLTAALDRAGRTSQIGEDR